MALSPRRYSDVQSDDGGLGKIVLCKSLFLLRIFPTIWLTAREAVVGQKNEVEVPLTSQGLDMRLPNFQGGAPFLVKCRVDVP